MRTCVVVVRELSSSFSRLCHYVDLTKSDLQQELNDIGTVITHLDDAATHSKSLKYVTRCFSTHLRYPRSFFVTALS